MRYFRVLIISLALHLLFAIIISQLPAPRLNMKPRTYVDLIERAELPKRPHQMPRDEKQFVRSVQIPDELLSKTKKDARFASEDERYVLEEQRARATDLTVNRSNEADGANAAKEQKREKSLRKMKFTPPSPLERIRNEMQANGRFGDLDVGDISRAEPAEEKTASQDILKSRAAGEKGFSTFGEMVPDSVKFGDFTALNTDRHLFYTFYARMEEKIRFRWVTYARAAMYGMAVDPRKATGKDNWVTKLEVILDKEGRYVRTILHESSGISSLDIAPSQAFKEAVQFPHPPQEMVKSDGMIHIYYSFSVNMGPGAVAGN